MFGKKKKKQLDPIVLGDYSLRSALPEQLSDIRRLILEAAKNKPSLVGLSYQDLKGADEKFWFSWINSFVENPRSLLGIISYKDNNPIGFIIIEGETEQKFWHTVTLTPIYIQEDFRDEVIEKSLLEGALNQLHKSTNIKKVKMSLTPDNAQEFPLYGSAGFVRFGFDEQHLKVGKKFYDCVLLVKSF